MNDYLARTTLDPGDWSAISEARNWVWTCKLQIDRIGRDFAEEFGRAWSLAGTVESKKMFGRTSADIHFLLTAGRNLLRYLKEVNGPPIDPDTALALRLLRNLYEHMDDPHTRGHFLPEARSQQDYCSPRRNCSARAFCRKWPKAFPWKIAWKTRDEVYLGDVLSLRVLMSELDSVEQWLAERS